MSPASSVTELTLRTYGHVIEELEDSPQLPAEEAIRAAREPKSDAWPERPREREAPTG